VTARTFGLVALHEGQLEAFSGLVRQYEDLMDRALEQQAFKVDHKVSESLRSMTISTTFTRIAVLGFLPGGSSDNVDDSQGFTEQGNDPDTFAENWNVEGNEASIKGGGPVGNEPAINLKGNEVAISLHWQDNTDIPDHDSIWSVDNGLLDYELQRKIKVEAQGSKKEHYMLGLSFRYIDDDNYYGISFFRSIGRDDNQRPSWIDDLPSSFDILMDGSPSIVYGKRFPGTTPCWITKKWMFPME
jgi:hypothetical protein